MTRPPTIVRDEGMRARIIEHIAGLNLGKPWAITVEPHRKTRSLSQNALMWKWLEEVVQHIHEDTGQDKEDIHEYLKRRFLMPKVRDVFGVVVQTWSTKGLEIADMSTYLDKIYAWATTEMGLLLPVPASADTGRTTEQRG